MGRDQTKSPSRHSLHEAPPPPPAARIPFETLVRETLDQLGEDSGREGLQQTPARAEASLTWLTRGYQMSAEDAISAAIVPQEHESMIVVRDTEIYSTCQHH